VTIAPKQHFISALGSTPWYSRLKYLTLRYILWRPKIKDIRIKICACASKAAITAPDSY